MNSVSKPRSICACPLRIGNTEDLVSLLFVFTNVL